MTHHVLIACAAKKLPHAAPASELYQSPLFRLSLNYARSLRPDSSFILSALHGLLPADLVVEPYDVTLNRMPAAERKAWAARVLADLARVADLQEDRFTILAGDRYRKDLVPHLQHVDVPLKGLRSGEQLQRLARRAR